VAGIYDTSPYSLFSLVFEALTKGKVPKIFGSDYPTTDGTCIRDYIPVGELADVHVVAAEKIATGVPLQVAYNIGTGTGHTVAEVMRVMAEETGIDFTPEYVDRRPGDPAVGVASGELARRDLEWNPNPDVREMVRTAWDAFQVANDLSS
jgi:UDP-glucose 4-epimerase